MKRVLLAVTAAAVLVVVGAVVWFYASTGLDESAEVTAPTIASAPETTAGAAAETTAGDTAETTAETTSETSAAADTAEGGVESTPQADGTVFELADESTVSFELDEMLRGEPNPVVGTNEEVAGQIRFDPTDLGSTEIGTVVISSQTFTTDQSSRDRAIRGPILDSNAEPTIEFAPTSIDGLSGAADVGDAFEFTVTGDLTIRGITREVTFDAEATLVAADRIEGTASATVLRSDFELAIPSVASVADVSDEVLIRIDFTAVPAG